MENRGEVNEYRCNECLHVHHTINLSYGVTPFGKRCPKCDGFESLSNFYRLTRPAIVTHAWFRPSKDMFLQMDESLKEHVMQGGLFCKPLLEACHLVPNNDPIEHGDWGEKAIEKLRAYYHDN